MSTSCSSCTSAARAKSKTKKKRESEEALVPPCDLWPSLRNVILPIKHDRKCLYIYGRKGVWQKDQWSSQIKAVNQTWGSGEDRRYWEGALWGEAITLLSQSYLRLSKQDHLPCKVQKIFTKRYTQPLLLPRGKIKPFVPGTVGSWK